MTREVAFVLAGRPPSPNEIRRGHWSARAASSKVWRQAAYLTAIDAARRAGLVLDPFRRAELDIVFVLERASGDLDNLLAGAKPIIDGISRGLGRPGERGPLLYDDGVGCLVGINVRWRRGRIASVEVRVREVE